MKVEILQKFTPKGQKYYEWSLHDGPENIDHVQGYASDLIQCFSKILEWHERIGQDYANEILEDMKTIETFLQPNNETLD